MTNPSSFLASSLYVALGSGVNLAARESIGAAALYAGVPLAGGVAGLIAGLAVMQVAG